MTDDTEKPIPYRPAMTLMPGQSTVVNIPIPLEVLPPELAEAIRSGKVEFVDISAQTLGKYQHCTLNKQDGMWYSDADYIGGGKFRRGALPSPRQDTPELAVLARRMHEAAAAKTTKDAMRSAAPRKQSFWGRLFSWSK